jgi:Protein of unknown function (DUF3048) N-terminal domain/Protein of unknown function (DUF3048) C-terminal domain
MRKARWRVPLTSVNKLAVLTGALLAVLLLLGACTDNEPAAREEPEAAEEEEEAPSVCPLTGEEPPKGIDLSRPAVALKIENSPDSRPQTGLDEADIVYEEIVEGGVTRFMALYHCHDAAEGGPVRSARFDDPKIAKPFTRILAFSGANEIVLRELNKQKLIALDELNASGPLFRVPPGSTDVHSVFADTVKLRKLGKERGKIDPPKGAYFEFGDLPGGAKKARTVTLHFNPSNEIRWRWKKDKWVRFEAGVPFNSSSGEQIGTPNLLVQEVDVNDSNFITDVAGNPSPDIDLEGKGRAFLFRDGQVVVGKWKANKNGIPSFETKSGDTFTFEVGSTWIELIPSKKGTVKGSIDFSKK